MIYLQNVLSSIFVRLFSPLERKQTHTEPLLNKIAQPSLMQICLAKIMRLCSTICQHSAMFTYQKIEFPLVFVKVLAETDERVEYKEKETSSHLA